MSIDDPMRTYRLACKRYTEAVVSATTTRDEAAERYRREAAEVKETAEQAVAERDAAVREAVAAKKLITEVDDACADVWRRLGSYIGPKHTVITPPPGTAGDTSSSTDVKAMLERTRRTIALVQRGEVPFAPPAHAVVVAAVIGLVTGALAAIGAGLLLSDAADGHAQALSQAAALVVVFVGAFLGIPVLSGWLATRHRIGPRPIHIGAVIIGAVAAMCALAPFTFVV